MPNPLNPDEVILRQQIHGFNEITEKQPNTTIALIREISREPMFILLILCATIYGIIGDKLEGVVLLSSVCIIIFITFYQHQKTEKALAALKRLSSPFATVERKEGVIKIPARELVPDDLMLVHEGEMLIADALILSSVNLMVDESILTGESFPVSKTLEDDFNKLFAGSFVLQGSAKVIVTETGNKTQMGKIGKSLIVIEKKPTRLQQEMNSLIKRLFIAALCISFAVIVMFYLVKGNGVQAILIGLSAAMAILPEEFPVVLTVFLTLGSWKLSKRQVLTKHPSAIENLGSITYLCTDKTGTITENKMAVQCFYDGTSVFTEKDFQKKEVADVLTIAYLACPDLSSDPMDKAIKVVFDSSGLQKLNRQLVCDYPFNKEMLSVTRVYTSNEKSLLNVAVKGAPEKIVERCELGNEDKIRHLSVASQLAQKGLRVLGLAKATIEQNQLPEFQNQFRLLFSGWIAFEDPIRKEVSDSVKLCSTAGVKLQLITGDYKETALEIGRQSGIYTNGKYISGDELDKLTDEDLRQEIKHVQVFYRVKPMQKLRIVSALKSVSEVVSMTGDGINDAPALKAADVGIAMGKRGTDVARESASLVVLDDNFSSIVEAIKMGRHLFDNLQKAMSYIIAIHIPIIGLTVLPVFMSSAPVFLMPLHVVLLELMIDPISSVVFESVKEEGNLMKRPPRPMHQKFFGRSSFVWSTVNGLLLFLCLIAVYLLGRESTENEKQLRALVFLTFISGNLLLVGLKLSESAPLILTIRQAGKTFFLMSVLIVGSMLVIFTLPLLTDLFHFEWPKMRSLLVAFVLLCSLLLVMMGIKKMEQRFK